MKNIVLLSILLCGMSVSLSSRNIQKIHNEKDSLSSYNTIDMLEDIPLRFSGIKTELFGGYSLNRGEKGKPTNHIIEVGVSKTHYYGTMEPGGHSFYAANGFLINKKGLAITPKIGANIGVWLICLGGNVMYYTNFKDNALFLEPYLGLGIGPGKLFVSYSIPVTEKKHPIINIPSVGFTLPITTFSSKKR